MDLNFFNQKGKNQSSLDLPTNDQHSYILNFCKALQKHCDKMLNSGTQYTIDKISEGFASLEDCKTKKIQNVPLEEIPNDAKEGDILDFLNSNYSINRAETMEAQKNVAGLMKKLRKN